jgi:flagellar hook-associated protein 1 FlgK
VVIRSAEGYQLAGDQAATLSYNRTDPTKGYIAIEPSGGIGQQQPITITSGDLRGLMDLRDTTLPAISNQIGEFATQVAQQINAASNASTSAPAPANLNGRNTGLDLPTAVSNFTGASTLAVVDSSGVVLKTVAIDFTAGTMSTDGGPTAAFTAGTFLSDLNTALGGSATASFNNGALSLSAPAGGLAIDQGTSNKAGQGFSQFFGLNDIIRSTGFTNYKTGLTLSDANGFTPGDSISLRVAQGDGKPIRDVTVAIPGGGTMQDLLDALNNTTTGVGLYGAYGLDANGTLAFTPTQGLDVSVAVTKDQSARGVGGPSVSQLFGLGVIERSTRANRLTVDPAMLGDPARLPLSKLDLTVAAGQSAIRAGDGTGALAISQAGGTPASFDAAGTLGAVTMTLTRYASEFGGSVGRQAAAAETSKQSAASVSTEASSRRQSVEGVNLDEELVRLTTYQQAFNASARMIQASKDLFDVLTQMI